MAYENIVGLCVADDEAYSEYRRLMTPILDSYGGGFRYDFRVSEVLINESNNPINRVFAIFFRDKNSQETFFADPAYLTIKEQHFVPAVQSTTIISAYET